MTHTDIDMEIPPEAAYVCRDSLVKGVTHELQKRAESKPDIVMPVRQKLLGITITRKLKGWKLDKSPELGDVILFTNGSFSVGHQRYRLKQPLLPTDDSYLRALQALALSLHVSALRYV